jgi:CheY-like chemotaxis protein
MESIGRLAGGVAHDFNNILGVILGNAELVMEQVGRSSPVHDKLTEIRKAAERSAQLTRQLLAFARKQTTAPRILDLNQSVQDMLKMLQRLIGENIELVWLAGRDLWPVKMDPGQIDQLMVNLCINGRDAISGKGKISIETKNTVVNETASTGWADYPQGDFVLLTVSDNGSGIDKETQAKIFEPFFTTKDVGRGSGLGLATVYGIVKQNNGHIHVDSEPGWGTTFKIYLPRHAGTTGVTQVVPAPVPAARGRETILLTEDEPALLKMTATMLERLGYTVLPAGNPREAVRLAREQAGEIHLLMTDVVMPEMNGRELADKLRTANPGLRCLYMSGYTADIIATHGVLYEGVHFIQKPFLKKDLAIKIREVLEEK